MWGVDAVIPLCPIGVIFAVGAMKPNERLIGQFVKITMNDAAYAAMRHEQHAPARIPGQRLIDQPVHPVRDLQNRFAAGQFCGKLLFRMPECFVIAGRAFVNP
ncbi:hypothetical protein BCM02_10293 [Paenibacillus methanolicus]|uniref:Uncharacterized protein n=1 Tax=Paenibacillus methanolicus TaxID=582686 RepID=A0A5S5CHN4_9BACL|nr:hypothetical protein BCM02_10293 [Paenibacillus methanolicus]